MYVPDEESSPHELHLALVQAADGYLEWVQQLIAAGADVNGMPLIMAIQCDEPEIVQALIDAGSDINIDCRETTPLLRAVTSSHPEIVRILIAAGADVNQADTKGCTPLRAAQGQVRLNVTQQERDAIIQMLKDAGAA
jgi:ankyrin repeat protein